jgi:hypothetical protein
MRIIRWTALALAGALAAVAVAPVAAQSVDVKPQTKVKRDKYVLTAEEIAERPDITNAYDAVKLLRSQFLKTTRSKGGLGTRAEGGGYRPDAIGEPVGIGGGSPGGSSSSGGSTGTSGEPPKPTESVGREGSGGTSAYGDATGGGNGTSAVLYIDEVKQPNLEEMKNIRVAEVFEIRYLTGNQAAGRYGAGHEGGAILLKTNRLGTKG